MGPGIGGAARSKQKIPNEREPNAETGWREADGQAGGRLPMFVGRS
jgi:hypothetical protein